MVVERDGTPLYWEASGSGEPVLLLAGLGMPTTAWGVTVAALARHFRVIAFDLRGSGRSGRPPGPYSLAQLVADALAVLDGAGEESAHVYGFSLGGMVAQELALHAPKRVRSLVLGATTPGGREHELPDAETLGFLRRRASMPAVEGVWASVPYLYGESALEEAPRRIADDVEQQLRFPPNRAGFDAQLLAASKHDAGSRLGDVAAPALVLHGSVDRIVPVANGRRLAGSLRAARFHELAGAGHRYFADAPEAADIVVRFLRQS